MIANARMYSVSPEAAALWRALLAALIETSGSSIAVIDHPEPTPLEELWRRNDKGAVFMCGLPYARAASRPVLLAAPVPSPPEFAGAAQYWSDLVVRRDSDFGAIEQTFGQRIAFTVPESQSGCVAALTYLMSLHRSQTPNRDAPLYRELIAPTITPLGALTAVVDGAADVAPIDSYALRLLELYRPELTSQVRVIAQTMPTPIPPLVASPEAASPAGTSQAGPPLAGVSQAEASAVVASSPVASSQIAVPQVAFPRVASPQIPLPLVASAVGAVAPQSSVGVLDSLRKAFVDAPQSPAIRGLMDKLLVSRFIAAQPSSYDILRDQYEEATRYWRLHRLATVIHPRYVNHLT